MNSFQSNDGRYAFLYPSGWTRVSVSDGPQVVFHDLINNYENLSLVISEVEEGMDLKNLGDPYEVAQRFLTENNTEEAGQREVVILDAEERQSGGHTFYDFEYKLTSNDRIRHELSTIVLDRGYLYTFATSTNESRWAKVGNLFEKVVTSFTFLV